LLTAAYKISPAAAEQLFTTPQYIDCPIFNQQSCWSPARHSLIPLFLWFAVRPPQFCLTIAPTLFNTTCESSSMAEAPQNIPQFKLVLVGDGGTGKVSTSL
jgi:hypothetical protein